MQNIISKPIIQMLRPSRLDQTRVHLQPFSWTEVTHV